MVNHRRRDEEAGVLQTRHALERNAHHQVVLHDRPAAVAGIDCGVGLHGEKRAVAAVHVILQLNARHHPARVGDLFAARRIAVRHHRRTNLGQIAEFERLKSAKETLILHFEQREVTVVRDEFDAREVRPRVLVAVHEDLLGPAHDVRVGHDALALDDEARTAAAADRVKPPRCVPDRLLAERHDLDDRTLRLGSQARARQNYRQDKTQELI